MSFATLALICLVAIIGPVLTLPAWLRLPLVVGELLVGLALGASGAGILNAGDATFSFLAEVGFALVMFVAGTHVPMRDASLRQGSGVGALRALAVGVIAVPLGLGLAAAFGNDHGFLYAVLIASSSAGLILPALAGIPLTAPAIVAAVPQIAIADAVCIVALPLAIDPAHVGRAALGAVAVLAAGVLVFFFLNWAERSGARRRVHNVSERNRLTLELRTSLALLFALAALAVYLHVSIMLAGFCMGLAVAAVGEPRRLAKQVFALTEGFFAPIFFVWLGASLNLHDLAAYPAALGLGLALGIAAVGAHTVVALTRQPWPIAAITSAQLGVPVAAATVGTRLGVLVPGEAAALLLGALVTIAVTALVAGRVVRIAKEGAPPREAASGEGADGARPRPRSG